MLGLTILSRAAASVMVPRVRTATTQEGTLSYEINGNGIIKENAKKYIELMNGYQIGQVYIKEGQAIEKGEVLFHYDLEQLQEKKTALAKELKKLQFQYEKTELGIEDGSTVSEAERKTEEAKDNKQLAEENEKRAEDDKESAEESLEMTKNALILSKQEEYENAASEFQDLLSEEENALITAQRKVDDANKELESLRKPKIELQEALTNYKTALETLESNKDELISKAYFAIFDIYYDGTYQEHQLAVENKREELRRAQEDLQDILMEWIYGTDPATIEKEEKSANRNLADIQKEFDVLTEQDDELDKAIDVYKRSVLKTENWSVTEAETLLFQLIYDKLNIDEDKISIAQTYLTRAEEDQDQVKAQWDKKDREALEKKDKLYSELTAMKQNKYDWQKELTNSENALQNADRAVTDSKNAVQTADRALEAAEIDQQKSSKTLMESNQAVDLELRSLTMDLEDKKTEIEEIQSLIDQKGIVKSPVSGVVLSSDLEQGAIMSGQESLIIATGDYELSMKGTKEELKHFAVGDELSIKAAEGDNRVAVNIENIELPDQDGNISFTALLPADGSYRVGGGLEFELQKNSKSYSSCIPIQAIRQDTNSTFILLIRETSGILGSIQTAFRLDVTVVSKDATSAAIDAPLSEEDEIIVSSNKNISEGDRVRVVKTE